MKADLLPADLCLVGQMLMNCTTDGTVMSADWRFVAERDIAARVKDRRIYYLIFSLADRSFHGRIMRGEAHIDDLTRVEVKVLRSLLPNGELAKALALSITRPAP